MQTSPSTLDTAIFGRLTNEPSLSFDIENTVETTFEYLHKSTDAAFLSLTILPNEGTRLGGPSTRMMWSGNRLDIVPPKSVESELLSQMTATGRLAIHEQKDDKPGYVLKLPLFVADRLSAHMTLAWEDSPAANFNPETVQLMLHAFAVSLETIRMIKAQQSHIQALEYIGALSGELNVLSNVKEVITRVVNTASVLLNVRRSAVIVMPDEKTDEVHAHGLPTAFLDVFKCVELAEGRRNAQQNAAPIEPSQVFSEGSDKPIPEKWQEIFAREGIRACVQAPLYSHNHTFGSFWLFYDRAHTPSPYDVRLTEILAAQASVALENITLNQANQEHAHMLEDRVAERTTELAIALDNAEDADRLKSQLLSTVSHELRTPLAVIKAHSSTIHTYYDRLPKERHLQYLSTINEEADRLSNMINSLLDMSRLEAGKLEIRPIPFQPLEVFEEVMESLRARYSDRPLIIELPSSLREVNADPERLRQLIANLVDNAVKYSPDESPITIGARAWDDSLEVFVKDEGNGLTPVQARRVFDRFYQTEDSDYRSARNGVGLGLAICKGLVEEMGGRIWCTSEGLKKGSKFAFTLPWAEKAVSTT